MVKLKRYLNRGISMTQQNKNTILLIGTLILVFVLMYIAGNYQGHRQASIEGNEVITISLNEPDTFEPNVQSIAKESGRLIAYGQADLNHEPYALPEINIADLGDL